MTGIKTEVEETIATEIGGPGMSVIEANGMTKVIVVNVGTVATVKIARDVIEVTVKGNGQAPFDTDLDFVSAYLHGDIAFVRTWLVFNQTAVSVD